MICLVVRTILTILLYAMSNYHTYNTGVEQGCNKPLKDVLHDFLPDLSKQVYIRDLILPFMFIPFLWIKDKWFFIEKLIEGFMILVTLKAITIFFTYCPPSNPDCQEKKYLNHCYHQMFSGHNALACILVLLYIKFNVPIPHYILWMSQIAYSILILMTRAHYSVDIIVSYIITLLLVQ